MLMDRSKSRFRRLRIFMLASYKAGITEKFYPTHADLLKDLAEIAATRLNGLSRKAWITSSSTPRTTLIILTRDRRQRMKQAGLDPDRNSRTRFAGDNAALQGVPRGSITVCVARLPGEQQKRWYTRAGYDAIAEKLFGLLDVDRFLLEYDSDRSGGFEPLRLVPRGKSVVLGLVTTKEPRMESQDELRRRIDEAAKYVQSKIWRSAAVRVCIRGRRESAFHRRTVAQARTRRGNRSQSMGKAQ